MTTQADLSLFDRRGQLRAAVEIRKKLDTSIHWAAAYRRNLRAHGLLPRADYYLLVTPDRLYLWGAASAYAPGAVEPTHAIDARPFFEPYYEKSQLTPATVSSQAFELLVGSWLADLQRSEALDDASAELAASGFLDAIRDGTLEYEAAA